MARYVVRAVPWPLVLAATATVVGMMSLVAAWPGTMWPLQGTSVGVLAAIAAWTTDEQLASIVDTTPRPLWWRTLARAAVVPLTLGTWAACLVLARHRLPDHLAVFVLQGATAVALGLAVGTWQRARGAAEPGRAFAAGVVPAAAALALIRPYDKWLPLFPIWPAEDWALSSILWICLGTGAILTLAITLPQRQPRPAGVAPPVDEALTDPRIKR